VKKEYHKRQELAMSDLGLCLEEMKGQPLELFAREGARLLLSVALEEEVTEFLGRRPYERSQGNSGGYRNGHRERKVSCGAGEIKIETPRISDIPETFHSQMLKAWQRRSQLLEETIPLLYVEGLSTRDFSRALKPLWGETGLSRSTISRANQSLKESFHNWRERDLSLEDILYLFLDGIYLGVRTNSRSKEAILVAHGITREGNRVVLHLSLGARESTESWKGLLNDLRGRGLKPPQLVISDGNPGLLRAIGDIWPGVPRQRCIIHRIWNILARVPKKRQEEIKKSLNPIFYAACLEDAKEAARHFISRYAKELPSATEVLTDKLEECLTFYRFPERHWKHIRTSNVLERSFKEVKRRTRVVGRFPTETSALMMVFGVLEENRLNWQKVRMRVEDIAWIEEASRALEREPVSLEFLKEALVS